MLLSILLRNRVAKRRRAADEAAQKAAVQSARAEVVTLEGLDSAGLGAVMARLEADAKAQHAQLVTTEKDAVRLPSAFRQKVLTLPVRLQIEDWSAIDAVLAKAGVRAQS